MITITPYIPLIYVFISGIGFSLQTLIIKLLAQSNFRGSFQCVFSRGFLQFVISAIFLVRNNYNHVDGNRPGLFGDTVKIKTIMFFRSLVGYGGIAFAFLAVERLPIGDSTVLVMLSPVVAAIGGFLVLGEPWRLPDFIATIISLTGAALVARPSFIFGRPLAGNKAADTLGVVFSLISSLSAGIAYVFIRVLGTTAKMPWANVCFAQAIGQIVLSIPSLYLSGQILTMDVSPWQLFLIFLGGFIGAWSQILMTLGLQREKSATGTAMRMSDVLFGFIWQVLFTDDAVSLLSVLGAALVASSILIIVAYKPIDNPTPAKDASKTPHKVKRNSTANSDNSNDRDGDKRNDETETGETVEGMDTADTIITGKRRFGSNTVQGFRSLVTAKLRSAVDRFQLMSPIDSAQKYEKLSSREDFPPGSISSPRNGDRDWDGDAEGLQDSQRSSDWLASAGDASLTAKKATVFEIER